MRVPIVFLILIPLATYSQPQSLLRDDACLTPEDMVETSLIFEEDSIEVLTWLNDDTAVHFVEFYNKFHKWTSGAAAVVADEIGVFESEIVTQVLVTLYRDGCLVDDSFLEGELFNIIMGKIGVEERKLQPASSEINI